MAAAKYKDEPLSDEDVYGKPEARPYREAITPEHLKELRAVGQEPSVEQNAQEAAADANAPEATGGDAQGPKA